MFTDEITNERNIRLIDFGCGTCMPNSYEFERTDKKKRIIAETKPLNLCENSGQSDRKHYMETIVIAHTMKV